MQAARDAKINKALALKEVSLTEPLNTDGVSIINRSKVSRERRRPPDVYIHVSGTAPAWVYKRNGTHPTAQWQPRCTSSATGQRANHIEAKGMPSSLGARGTCKAAGQWAYVIVISSAFPREK